jgi:putative hemolysin
MELLLAIIVVLLLSALFSGAEIAFVSASKLKIELDKTEGSSSGKIIAGFYDNARDFIGTMLVGNNISLVIFTYLFSKVLDPLLSDVADNGLVLLLLSTVIITIIVLIFGEFLPKTFFGMYANESLRLFAYPLLFFKYILSVPVWVMTRMSTFLLKYIFKSSLQEGERIFTKIDLENFVRGTHNSNHEDEIDKELFENALHFNKVKVKECMVPRKEVIAIDVNESIKELEIMFKENGVSRIVVIDDDIDNVLGYTHHQSLLKNPRSIKAVMMPIPIVPEVMSIYDVLNRFIKDRNSIACVVDEYGGTAGIITMEDILEELFGDIEDEHDKEDYIEEQISENEFLFSGRLELGYLNETYEALDLPEGEYSTLSGYIVMTTETIPEQGSTILLDNYKFIIEAVSDTKIETVRVIKLEDNN